MKTKLLLCCTVLLLSAAPFFTGCSFNPGDAVPATQAELDNDPALREAGV